MKHKLTSPTISVQSETFLPLLSTTNQHGLPDAHPNDMESPAYLTKFRACLTRALGDGEEPHAEGAEDSHICCQPARLEIERKS